MEWLVPILFVLASLAQWWMQRNRQGQEELPPAEKPSRSGPSRRETEPPQEFGDFGDLMEALGRRRHEAPPPSAEQVEPPVLPTPPPPSAPLPKRESAPAPRPEPVIIFETPEPLAAPVFTPFPEPKSVPMPAAAAFTLGEDKPGALFRPFPSAKEAQPLSSHRWAHQLRSVESVREALVLSEILAPPVSLR